MGEVLDVRRKQTTERLDELKGHLPETEAYCSGKACIYATGSYGRGESSQFSDLDLFIVGKESEGKRALGKLDEICMKADLIEATREMNIQEFSGEGQYLVHYSQRELIDALGKPEDDATNTFTARLLLLLESRPVVEEEVYSEILGEVVGAYWQDFEDHKRDFVPAFLANDILRLWRTFCVNYEARTSREPAIKKAKRKLKNYKLKHSRLLTCYSALLYLLFVHNRNGTVTPMDANAMVRLSPTERLEQLAAETESADARKKLMDLLAGYEQFLAATARDEDELVALIMEKGTAPFPNQYEFGDIMFDVMDLIGGRTRFHRLLVV
jgi:predicted nucleotidyltransferase